MKKQTGKGNRGFYNTHSIRADDDIWDEFKNNQRSFQSWNIFLKELNNLIREKNEKTTKNNKRIRINDKI